MVSAFPFCNSPHLPLKAPSRDSDATMSPPVHACAARRGWWEWIPTWCVISTTLTCSLIRSYASGKTSRADILS